MKRYWAIAAIAAAIYAALMGLIWAIGTQQAAKNTESLLDYAILDFRDTIGGAIDTMLGSIARHAVRDLGKAEARPMEDIAALAKDLDIDEINVVSREGVIIASNDPHCLGACMAGDPVMDAFMALTNGTVASVSQPFRPHARNPEVRAKYLAVAFPGGDGFVQVGLDESHLAEMLPGILGYIFDEWLLGSTGFFLCADAETDRLISNPSRHRDEARTLAEAGFDAVAAAPFEVVGNTSPGTTFRQKLFGENCHCRNYLFGGHRFVPALPDREFYDTRTVYTVVFGVLLFAVIAMFACFIGRIFSDADRLKAFYAAEESRRNREMDIAKTIQTSALPGALPENPVYRLAASMTPARDVGGDFYDHFPFEATHIAFLVADVSGKGITAALYMMTAKNLLKNRLLAERDVAAALASANADLCRNNPANMFLTAWVGVLDTRTGHLDFANAGHNPPLLRRADGSVERLRAKSGPMLAVVDDAPYRAHSATLRPGDTLFLYTDGVTEAMDTAGALFGEQRLEETLSAAPDGDPASINRLVRAAVAAFAAGAPAADDLTVLAVQQLTPPRHASNSFPATREGLAAASAFLDEILADTDPGLAPPLHVMLDEIVSNVVNYSGATVFEIDASIAGTDSASLAIADNGKPYDPLAHDDPDTTLDAADRPIGGLGILIVKKMSDAIAYRREGNRNILTFMKTVKGKKTPRGGTVSA